MGAGAGEHPWEATGEFQSLGQGPHVPCLGFCPAVSPPQSLSRVGGTIPSAGMWSRLEERLGSPGSLLPPTLCVCVCVCRCVRARVWISGVVCLSEAL